MFLKYPVPFFITQDINCNSIDKKISIVKKMMGVEIMEMWNTI